MKKKLIFTILILAGILVYIYSLYLQPFKDSSIIEELRNNYPENNITEASNNYFYIYEKQLTNKYSLENYSIGIIILSFSLLIIKKIMIHNNYIVLPKKRVYILLIGIFATLITYFSSIFELLLGFYRLEYPPWSDSLGIPIIEMLSILIFGIIISIIYYLFLIKYYNNKEYKIFDSKYKFKITRLILILPPLLISILLLIYSILIGEFMLIIPFELWIIFYLYILLGKKYNKI